MVSLFLGTKNYQCSTPTFNYSINNKNDILVQAMCGQWWERIRHFGDFWVAHCESSSVLGSHQSVIMAQLPNSWITIAKSGFIIRLRGPGNWGQGGWRISRAPKALPNKQRRELGENREEDCFQMKACRTTPHSESLWHHAY